MSGSSCVSSRRREARAATALLAALVAALALATSASADAAIEITEGSPTEVTTWGFAPPEVTVAVGDKVTWTNTGSVEHTATHPDGAFDTGLIAPGESMTITMSSAGTFGYLCQPHPWMRGILTVTAAAAETSEPALATPTVAAAPPTAAPASQAASPTAAPAAQAQPTPTVLRVATPTPLRLTPTTTTPPRAGGMPLELAVPLMAAGASALAGGLYVLRSGRRAPRSVAEGKGR